MFNDSTGFTMPVVPAGYGYGNSGNGMFGGDGWWAIIIILFLFGGFGRGGFGIFGGGNGGGSACATQADLAAGFNNSTVLSSLDDIKLGQANAINYNNQGFSGLNTAVMQGFHGVDNAICTLGYQNQQGRCETQRAIDGVNYNLATQACDIKNTIQNTTRDIIDNQNCNTRSILDFLVNDKISTLQSENQALKFQASQSAQNAFISANQEAQTAELIRRLGADCPVPAYVVPNPNCCYNPFGFGYGNGCGNSGCGCA